MPVARDSQIRSDPINIGCMIKLPVVAVLVLYIQHDVKTTQGADREPDEIDHTEGPVLAEEPQRGFYIALEHGMAFVLGDWTKDSANS